MEFKVRKESQSLLEKVFNQHETNGSIKASQVPELMKQMQPGFVYDENELKNVIENAIPKGSDAIDWTAFNKIAMHFILKAARRDSDQFIHKHSIGDADFSDQPTAKDTVAS